MIFIFRVINHIWTKQKVLYDHLSDISSISIQDNLNMFSSGSSDTFANLYTLPYPKIVRSIRSPDDHQILHVFLSRSPLPALVMYTANKTFFSFSINGSLIKTEEFNCPNLMSPVVFTDYTFKDYLVR